ncbi:hypothetical protein SAMN05444673_3558 [Bacillus sp. OV166]|nr:hypothetical protein SAMN05444673_3558 [Bacillus sp. OV166]
MLLPSRPLDRFNQLYKTTMSYFYIGAAFLVEEEGGKNI